MNTDDSYSVVTELPFQSDSQVTDGAGGEADGQTAPGEDEAGGGSDRTPGVGSTGVGSSGIGSSRVGAKAQ